MMEETPRLRDAPERDIDWKTAVGRNTRASLAELAQLSDPATVKEFQKPTEKLDFQEYFDSLKRSLLKLTLREGEGYKWETPRVKVIPYATPITWTVEQITEDEIKLTLEQTVITSVADGSKPLTTFQRVTTLKSTSGVTTAESSILRYERDNGPGVFGLYEFDLPFGFATGTLIEEFEDVLRKQVGVKKKKQLPAESPKIA